MLRVWVWTWGGDREATVMDPRDRIGGWQQKDLGEGLIKGSQALQTAKAWAWILGSRKALNIWRRRPRAVSQTGQVTGVWRNLGAQEQRH